MVPEFRCLTSSDTVFDQILSPRSRTCPLAQHACKAAQGDMCGHQCPRLKECTPSMDRLDLWACDLASGLALGLAPRHRQAFGRKLPPGQQRHMRSSSGRTCNLEPCCRCRCSNFQWRCSSYRSNCRGFCIRLIDQHELFGTRHRPSAGIDCCICLRTAYDRRDICRKPCNPKFPSHKHSTGLGDHSMSSHASHSHQHR